MGRIPLLESFDTAPLPPVESGPSEDWRNGHAAGLAEGRAAAAAEHRRLTAEAVQALADLAFGFRETEIQVLARLSPLFRALADSIVPQVMQATLGLVLAEAIDDAAAADAARPAVLQAHPDDCDGIGDAVRGLPGHPFEVRPDPRLPRGQVLLTTGMGATSFDFDRLNRDIAAALEALCGPAEERFAHG